MVRSLPRKMLYGMAARIHEQINQVSRPALPQLPQFEWEDLMNTVLRMAIVEARGCRPRRASN